MRTSLLGSVALLALATVGCGTTRTTFVKSETTLGRVVVYRNGVAYFERYADVQGDSLRLNVPEDKVDDFLKSLTVVDAVTGEPAPISYPSTPSFTSRQSSPEVLSTTAQPWRSTLPPLPTTTR